MLRLGGIVQHLSSHSRLYSRPFLRSSFFRHFSALDGQTIERESIDYDVVVVGAGCAGLATAIRLKTEALKQSKDLSVCILEKGEMVGSHVLSGCLLNVSSLDKLVPDWKERNAPITQMVKQESMQFLLGQENSFTIPHCLIPKPTRHMGSYIVCLSNVTRWLSEIAEELGVDVLTDTGVSSLLIEKEKAVGVITVDKGIDPSGNPKEDFLPGYEIRGKSVVLAEGCLGSVTEEAIQQFNLHSNGTRTYGLGIKEVWELPDSSSMAGQVIHTLGYPLQRSFHDRLYGGGFLYFQEPNLLHIGYITALDYENTFLSPYEEFQLFKQTNFVASILRRGERLEYGARVIYEGGELGQCASAFPGGLIVGEGLGVMNMASLQGTHNAIESGIIAADSLLQDWEKVQQGSVVSCYPENLKRSQCMKELHRSRSNRAMFGKGLFSGMVYSFVCGTLLGNHNLFTHSLPPGVDWEKTKRAEECKEMPSRDYEKPDNIVSFDRESSLALSSISYPDELSHIRVKEGMEDIPVDFSLKKFDGPEQRFCPANVYEYVKGEDGNVGLKIHNENCLQCKACVVKTPKQFVKWTAPSSGGPNYSNM